MKTFLSALATGCAFALGARAQTLVRAVTGPAANASYGKACIVVSDQNGDAYKDLLVGWPGFNAQRGAVSCLSGAYLKLGTGTQTLWSLTPTANAGDSFGAALAEIADATGDGVNDFLVGQPGYDAPTASDAGAVRLVDGATHAIVALRHGPQVAGLLGSAMAVLDSSFVVLGAPGPNALDSQIFVVDATHLATSGALSTTHKASTAGSLELGASLAAGHDFDGDGHPEILAGIPGVLSAAGGISMYSFTPSGAGHVLAYRGSYIAGIPGERLGASLDAAHDYDGDGLVDMLVGAPDWSDGSGTKAGRVLVLSGTNFMTSTPPFELYTLTSGIGSSLFDFQFGAAVRASADLNGDGVGEILVGAPGYTTSGGGVSNHRGLVSVFSGATGARWEWVVGGDTDRLGDALAGALQDLDGDGFEEFVIAGSASDAGGTDAGVVKCYGLFPVASATYCTAKTNSQGCAPAMSSSGTASAGSSAPFLATCAQVLNQKNGLLFYSHVPNAAVFQGGLLCVKPPTKRTALQDSGGSTSGSDCSGTFSFDFTARIQSGVDPTLVAGSETFCQYWSRDAQSASGTSLSNALVFVINP